MPVGERKCKQMNNCFGSCFFSTQVTIHGLLVLLSFVLCYIKYRNIYVHESECNRTDHVRKVRVCLCVWHSFVSSCSRFRYLGTCLTDQYCIHEKFKGRFSSGNVLDHLVQNILSSV